MDCVMPAAGLSARMGRWKLLLNWRCSTVVDLAITHALSAVDRVILVTGHRGDELETRFADQGRVVCIRNPRYRVGMFSSIQVGVGLVDGGRFFVALADMPDIPGGVYQRLLREPGDGVYRPTYRGNPGHPVLLPAAAIPAVLAEPADSSMRVVLSRFEVHFVPTDEAGVLFDLDVPGDLAAGN